MEKTIVTSGKSIDLAIEAALTQLGLDRDSVSVQVLQQAKTGFLGFGAQLAKVQVTYEVPDPVVVPEPPKAALSSASRSKPKPRSYETPKAPEPPKPVKQEEKPAPQSAESRPSRNEERPSRNEERSRRNDRGSRPPKEPREPKAPRAPQPPKDYVPAEPGSVEEKIETFIKGLVEHMGSQAIPHCWKEENTYRVDLVGEDLGFLIGRRGDTLDAIQHLANYAVNRDTEGRIRISVDAESYRAKREDSLRRYARKKAQQVLKAHRRITLEPMNAYERHVIHAALQDMENITTHSTGVEPNRCVVIEYIR